MSGITIKSREQLLYTLIEAAEIEHNLMCCYLYAAWSLKTEPGDGVDEAIRNELKSWQQQIIAVAVDEMSHLSLTANLIQALGGSAHLMRPNFPIATGYHPAGLQVRLAPFDRSTLQHFIYLERPEDVEEPDGADFPPPPDFRRGLYGLTLMPSGQDFPTVGHLYNAIEDAIKEMRVAMGEKALFCGDPRLQVGPDLVSLPGLIAVTDLATACKAIETIVTQGEGSRSNCVRSHFQRFMAIRTAYEKFAGIHPDFEPAFRAATNPVMRKPPEPQGRVWIQYEQPRAVLDLGNAVYNHMLRFLMQGFADTDRARKKHFLDAAIDLMYAVDPLARELARLKANCEDGCNAGLSFATLRSIVPIDPKTACFTLRERLKEMAQGTPTLVRTPRVEAALKALMTIYEKLEAIVPAAAPQAIAPESAVEAPAIERPAAAVASAPVSPVDYIEGRDMTLIYEGKRCIHARFCVTGAPKSFVANVPGDWIFPDETPVDRLVEIAHACPSGAIGYRRKDGKPDEEAPPVNLLTIREAGPYALKAELVLAGTAIGYRATLCRCGASKNKPFCDGSHHDIDFSASGEPKTVSLDPLSVRNGPLRVDPQRNGPLKVEGNLEICAGTGRVVQRVTEARLCRCGHSQSKPFCDGSHRAAGFEAEGV